MGRFIQAFAFAMILLGLAATPARAGLIISAGDVTLAPGGTGTMAFTIKSTSNDTLSQFGLELKITTVGATTMQFTSTQPVPYTNANYVFAGQSFLSDHGSIPFWNVSNPPIPFVTVLGGDMDDSHKGYVTIPGTASGLHSYLATVQFHVPQGATPGDQFQLSLLSNPHFTYFDDKNGKALSYSFSGPGGMVSVGNVPEPSSLLMLALSSSIGLLHCYRRGRKRYQ
jgi:hypothetical protein